MKLLYMKRGGRRNFFMATQKMTGPPMVINNEWSLI